MLLLLLISCYRCSLVDTLSYSGYPDTVSSRVRASGSVVVVFKYKFFKTSKTLLQEQHRATINYCTFTINILLGQITFSLCRKVDHFQIFWYVEDWRKLFNTLLWIPGSGTISIEDEETMRANFDKLPPRLSPPRLRLNSDEFLRAAESFEREGGTRGPPRIPTLGDWRKVWRRLWRIGSRDPG